jgi:hypothetical protein
MRKLEREAPPGAKWLYKTGETNLIGVLASSATKKRLSDYNIFRPNQPEADKSLWGQVLIESCHLSVFL